MSVLQPTENQIVVKLLQKVPFSGIPLHRNEDAKA
jgi:hypothetical protein